MNTQSNTSPNKVAEQIANNSTGWVGEVPGNKEHFVKGQTFVASGDGDLQAIKVFTNVVAGKNNVMMTIHNYDPLNHRWGQAIGSVGMELQGKDAGKWISFDMHGPHLNKGQSYGFRLDTKDSFIGIGEACGNFRHPAFKTGREWQFTNNNPEGDSFSYFSLAFKVEVAA